MMKKVVIFGTGEFAQVASVYLRCDSAYEVAAFTVDPEHRDAKTLQGLDVVSFADLERTHPPDRYAMFVAIGFSKLNRARAQVFERCKVCGYELISYINSKAIHWGEFSMGENCFIFENNVIQPFVKIGQDVILWSGNHIGHHVTIGDHCFVTSQVVLSGGVSVGSYSFVGVNATVRDHVTIAPSCVIGAGALILEDTREAGVYATKGTEASPVPSHRLRGF
jgi:sugar O-acyltransferase (sialic acid O-acetyltransferase NeuD family)